MKIFRLGVVAGCALALTACPPADRPIDDPVVDPAVEAPRVDPADPAVQPPVGAQQVQLEPLAGSGVTGEIHAAARDDRTDIMIMLRGAQPNESYGARVQSGTCASPGPELARLDALGTDAAGNAHSETNVGHAPHLIMDGNHIVAVYAPGTEPERDQPVACATLPQAGGTQM